MGFNWFEKWKWGLTGYPLIDAGMRELYETGYMHNRLNPITQSEKFDSEGIYIKQHVPELSGLPSKYIHAPWQAPESILKESGVELGNNYPYPIVDIKASRQKALEAFAQTKM